uniref:Gag protein n=1 Tax=Meloidogyne javanica TaxID=6303 RepID=A0A915MAY0_MELJA
DDEEESDWRQNRRMRQPSAPDFEEPSAENPHETSRQTYDYQHTNSFQQPQYGLPNALKVDSVRLPTFGGDIRDWRTFWSAFEHAVDKQHYPSFQKHLLLLQYLKEGSAAREAIIGYPPSDDNYKIVKEILKKKYGNDDQLSNQLQAQLLKLPPIRNNLRELTQFQKDIERICLQLEYLDNQSPMFLCNIIKSKLPHGILQELIAKELDAPKKWTHKELRRALENIVNIRQATDECMNSFHDEPSRRQEVQRSNQQQVRQEVRQLPRQMEHTRAFPVFANANNANANYVNREEQNLPQSCSLCAMVGHRPSRCPSYSTPQQRKLRLLEQSRCLKCLQQSHTTDQCQRSFICRQCGGDDHHFLICIPPQAKIGYSTPQAVSYAPRLALQSSSVQLPTPTARSVQQSVSRLPPRQTPPRRNERPMPKVTGGNAAALNNQRATTTMSSLRESTDSEKEVKEETTPPVNENQKETNEPEEVKEETKEAPDSSTYLTARQNDNKTHLMTIIINV